jgi:hypothetical protein
VFGAFGVAKPAVLIEVVGIILMLIVIYKIDGKNETSH